MGFLSIVPDFIERLGKHHRLLPWLFAYALLLPVPFVLATLFNEYLIDLANRICLFILLAVGLNIVKGFCGQVTVGHIGLYAIGAVTSAVLALEPGGFGGALGFGWPVWLAIPMAVLVTAFAGLIIGLPSVRLEGAYLALATLGLGESVRIFIAVTPALGSSTGLMMIPAPSIGSFVFDSFTSYYYLVMTAALAGIYFSFSILHSATGRAFQAIREDTIAASVNGINVVKYKLLAFVLSAIYAGLAGALFAHAALTGLGEEVLLIPEIDKGVQPLDCFDDHIAAAPAIATVRAAVFDVFFAPERHGTAAAAAGADVYTGEVEVFHGSGIRSASKGLR